MNNIAVGIELIHKYSRKMGGVFSLSDLKGLFPFLPQNVFYRKIANFEKAGVLKRFMREIYLADEPDICVLSQKICPESYISFETVLAKNMIIGTLPSREIKAVKIGKRREYISGDFRIIHFGLSKELFFGFVPVDGINFAVKEKALLDTLYFYIKGMRYYFDIYSDVDLKKIDTRIMRRYLSSYKNPKFIKFVERYLKEGGI